MKEKKAFLIEALVRMAMAYASMDTNEASGKFDETLQHLKAWVDIDGNGKYAALVIERESRAGRYGNVLKVVNKLLAKDTKDEAIKPLTKSDLLVMRAKIFEKLGFSLLVEYDKSTRVMACPKSFRLF
jgi:DNA-binding SARP family transcriptional activator